MFIVVKEDVSDKKALVSCFDNSNEWIIDSGCSHHMTGERSKFLSLEEYDVVWFALVMMHHVWSKAESPSL